MGREGRLDAGARYGEGGAVGAVFQWIEAGEQRAPRLEDVVEHPRIFRPAIGIDGAEACVLPHRVEDLVEVRAESEDIAPLECGARTVALGEVARLGDRHLGEIEPRDHVAATGEESRIVTATGAGDGDAGARREGPAAVEPSDEGRGRLSQLPSVLARSVEAFPEGGGAYGRAIAGHVISSKSATARSAPA